MKEVEIDLSKEAEAVVFVGAIDESKQAVSDARLVKRDKNKVTGKMVVRNVEVPEKNSTATSKEDLKALWVATTNSKIERLQSFTSNPLGDKLRTPTIDNDLNRTIKHLEIVSRNSFYDLNTLQPTIDEGKAFLEKETLYFPIGEDSELAEVPKEEPIEEPVEEPIEEPIEEPGEEPKEEPGDKPKQP